MNNTIKTIVENVCYKFIALPIWVRVFIIIIFVNMLSGVWSARGEHDDFFVEFILGTLAYALWSATIISFFGAIFLGFVVANKTKSNALGWLVGIFLTILISASELGIKEIPGVGWRYTLIRDSAAEKDWTDF